MLSQLTRWEVTVAINVIGNVQLLTFEEGRELKELAVHLAVQSVEPRTRWLSRIHCTYLGRGAFIVELLL